MFVAIRRFLKRHRLTETVGKGIFALVVVALVLALGSKFWVQHRVTRTLEETAGQLRGIGSLSYGSVNAGFDGELTVSRLAFRPEATLGAAAVPLVTDAAVLDFGSYAALVRSSQRQPPQALELRLEGIRLDFGATGNLVSGNPAEALACGDVQAFEAVDLQRMGFEDSRADLRLAYRLNRVSDQLTVRTELATGDAASAWLELALDVPGLAAMLRTRNPLAGGEVRLLRASLASDAAAFNRRRNAFCADELGVTAEQALDANREALVAMLAELGWTPDQAFLDQYGRFMAGEGTWKLVAEPDAPMSLAALGTVNSLPALLELLDVRGAVGRAAAQSFSFDRVARVASPPESESRPASRGLSTVARWAPKPLDTLERFTGRNVSMTTASGERYFGELLATNADEVTLRARLPGGEAVVPIPRAQLREFKVYERYRPGDEPSTEGP